MGKIMNKIREKNTFISVLISAVIFCLFLSGNTSMVFALDTAKHGYGQGTAVDGENRPTGAVDFNSLYGKYNAYALNSEENRIILTFDQGYENGYTAPILDTLKEKNVRAIFFLTGDYAKKETELVKRMIEEGHTLGNHGMTHASMPALSESEMKEEIMSLHNYVLENYGYEMQYLRPPCGEFSETSLSVTQLCGYKTLFWSYAYVDWITDKQPEPASSLQKAVNAGHSGGIFLLHSVSSTNAQILGDVIDGLRAKGFVL